MVTHGYQWEIQTDEDCQWETNNLWVTFLHSSLDVAYALIILLHGNDLTLQDGCEGNLER
jgi:hypothetical protein